MPSCQIPWAIFQQICVKWNHTGLTEDVQNQQRGQRMRMIHIVTMNIIHSDTDDNKVSECAGFQSCLPCLSNVYIIYSLIQSNQSFYLCWVILSGVSFWHGFPLYRTHTNALTGVAISLQALIWHCDMSHKILLSSAHICGIIYLSHTLITELKAFHLKVVHNCYWYADHTHCPWINDALVSGHETWLAFENYIWLTVTSSLHIDPILIN